jgi:hypothetical protein
VVICRQKGHGFSISSPTHDGWHEIAFYDENGELEGVSYGCQWWSTAWPVNRALETPELIAELDGGFVGFRKAFRNREAMARWCREHAQPTSDPTEFHAWYEGKHGSYWLRMITRRGDYNLYLHCLSRAALKSRAVPSEG